MRSRCMVLTIFLIFAPATGAQAGRTFCQIDVNSQKGGRLEVITWDYGPASLKLMHDNPTVRMMPPPVTILWHPPSTGTSMDLVFSYDGSDLAKLDAATEATTSFAPIDGVKPEKYASTVTSDGARTWQFAGAQTDEVTNQMWVTLADDVSPEAFTNARSAPDRVSVLALGGNKHLTITVNGGHQSDLSASFDTSATESRDQLLAYARHLVETQDARVCRERD
jgi:hypothetical protein